MRKIFLDAIVFEISICHTMWARDYSNEPMNHKSTGFSETRTVILLGFCLLFSISTMPARANPTGLPSAVSNFMQACMKFDTADGKPVGLALAGIVDMEKSRQNPSRMTVLVSENPVDL